MQSKNVVSVNVVTYNHKNYIKQCLDGILMQQTNFPFEIIVGEDESSDGTREICIDYANRYPDKIKLFLRSRKDVVYVNGSPTGRNNFIENLKVCSSKYIALCEGDDYWSDPLKLQKQVDVLKKNPHLIGCFHNCEERYWNDYTKASKLFVHYPNGREISIKEIAEYNMLPTCSVVFINRLPKELFTNEFLKLPVGDWPLHLLNTRKGNYFYLPQVMSVRNLSSDSMWGLQDHNKNIEKLITGFDLIINYNWFAKEINELLTQTCRKLKNSIKPKKETINNSFKKKIANHIISLLKKI